MGFCFVSCEDGRDVAGVAGRRQLPVPQQRRLVAIFALQDAQRGPGAQRLNGSKEEQELTMHLGPVAFP